MTSPIRPEPAGDLSSLDRDLPTTDEDSRMLRALRAPGPLDFERLLAELTLATTNWPFPLPERPTSEGWEPFTL